MNNTMQQGVLCLVQSAISTEAKPLPEGFDLAQAMPLIKKHQIGNLVYYGAVNCGIDKQLPVMQELFAIAYKCIITDERQGSELRKLMAAFDKEGIHYLPLKGVLMKHLYPQTDMRIMGDADIMIKMEQYDKITAVVKRLGYAFKVETDHELVWDNSGLHLELHKRLVPAYNSDFIAYYDDCWRFGKPVAEDSCRFEMTDEDQMVYLFTHFAKHYRNGGIGIRHMLDLYVYRKAKSTMDELYVIQELKKLQLDKFYSYIFSTLSVWFENGEGTQQTELITEHIFQSGAYGTSDRRFMATAIRDKAQSGETSKQIKRKKWIHMVFLPYSSMCVKYPFLKKIPILLPFMWIVRWLDTLIRKPKNILHHHRQMELLQDDSLRTFEDRMNFVGLSVGFEENE